MNETLPSKVDNNPFRTPLTFDDRVDFGKLSMLLSEYTMTVARYRTRAEVIFSEQASPRKTLSGRLLNLVSDREKKERTMDDLSYLAGRLKRVIGIGSTYSEQMARNELEKLEIDLKLFEAENELKSCLNFIDTTNAKSQ